MKDLEEDIKEWEEDVKELAGEKRALRRRVRVLEMAIKLLQEDSDSDEGGEAPISVSILVEWRQKRVSVWVLGDSV